MAGEAPPVCLTISGSDCSGSTSAQADLKTFTALGTYGCAVLTSVVAQNPTGLGEAYGITEHFVRQQLEAVAHLPIASIKVGVVPTPQAIRVVGRWLRERKNVRTVIDPVIANHLGIPHADTDTIKAIQTELLPRATVMSANRFEAALLTGMDEVLGPEDMEQAAKLIYEKFHCPAIITGGGLGEESLDVFCGIDGISHFRMPKVTGLAGSVQGAGCTFSAAICAALGKGESVRESIQLAKRYVHSLLKALAQKNQGLNTQPETGTGRHNRPSRYASGGFVALTAMPSPGAPFQALLHSAPAIPTL